MKYALIVDGAVRELFADRPEFHPDLRVVEVADEVETGWVEGKKGVLAAPAPVAPTPEEIRATARALLVRSDGVAIRCLKAGLSYPAEWIAYDITLRAIVASGALPEKGWPERPDFPA